MRKHRNQLNSEDRGARELGESPGGRRRFGGLPGGLIVESVAWWGLCLGVWVVTLSAVSVQELLVATPLALLSGILAAIARRATGNRWRVRPRWLAAGVLLPVAIAADAVRVLAAGATRPPGRFVELPVSDGAGDGALARGRRAAATILITVTPGTVVLDIDPGTGKAILHALGEGPPRMEEVVG